MASDAEKTASAEVKAAARAEQDKIKEKTKADRETEALRNKAVKTSLKALDEEFKAYEKGEKAKIKETEKWARQREIIQTNSAKLAFKLAEQEVRAAEMAAKKSAEAREKWSRGMGSTVSSSLGSLGRTASVATSMAGGVLALGGGFSIADIMQKSFAANRTAALLVNAVTSGGKVPQEANVANILARAGGIAQQTGIDKNDLIGGSLAYARSARGGDFNGAMSNMAFFAKMSKVTGASINDIASAAGTLQSQNADLGKDPEAMRGMLLNAYAGTKNGTVSMADAAKQMGVLGSTRGFFQGDVARNQSVLMGLGQIGASGASKDEIGTIVKDFSMEIASKRMATSSAVGLGGRGTESLGVKFNKSGQMESPEQAIGAIFKATGGDLSKVGGIVGKKGLPIFTELAKSFQDAGGGDKGVAAVQNQIRGVTQSTMTEKDLDSQFNQSMNNPAEKFAKATQQVSEVIEAKLTPYLEAFADKLPAMMPKIEGAIDGIGKLADFFVDNPFTSIGAIVMAAVTKDIAAAAIGEAVKSSLSKAISGDGGSALGLAVAGGVAITAASAWIETGLANQKANSQKTAGDLTSAQNAMTDLAADPTNKDKQEAAKKVITQIKQDQLSIGKKDGFGAAASWLQSADDQKEESSRNKKLFLDLADSANKLQKALDKAAASADKTVSSPTAPNRKDPLSGGSKS